MRGKPFKKGNNAAVGHGRPRLPDELAAVQRIPRSILELQFARFAMMTIEQLQNVLANEDAPMIDILVARVFQAAYISGDYKILNFIFNQMSGKIEEKIEIKNKPYEAIDVTPQNHDELWSKAHSITQRLRIVNTE